MSIISVCPDALQAAYQGLSLVRYNPRLLGACTLKDRLRTIDNLEPSVNGLDKFFQSLFLQWDKDFCDKYNEEKTPLNELELVPWRDNHVSRCIADNGKGSSKEWSLNLAQLYKTLMFIRYQIESESREVEHLDKIIEEVQKIFIENSEDYQAAKWG